MAKKEEAKKKWKDMTNEEKLAFIIERRKELSESIPALKKRLSEEKKELSGLDDKEKAIRYDILMAEKAEKAEQKE